MGRHGRAASDRAGDGRSGDASGDLRAAVRGTDEEGSGDHPGVEAGRGFPVGAAGPAGRGFLMGSGLPGESDPRAAAGRPGARVRVLGFLRLLGSYDQPHRHGVWRAVDRSARRGVGAGVLRSGGVVCRGRGVLDQRPGYAPVCAASQMAGGAVEPGIGAGGSADPDPDGHLPGGVPSAAGAGERRRQAGVVDAHGRAAYFPAGDRAHEAPAPAARAGDDLSVARRILADPAAGGRG